MTQPLVVGKFGAPYGIKGWIKVYSYTDPIDNLLEYPDWLTQQGAQIKPLKVDQKKRHGALIIAKLAPYDAPETVRTLTNQLIYVDQKMLTALPDGEYYWADLIGLSVFDTKECLFGKVDHMFETGAHDVMAVKSDQGAMRLIPYTDQVLLHVDLETQRMVVNWECYDDD